LIEIASELDNLQELNVFVLYSSPRCLVFSVHEVVFSQLREIDGELQANNASTSGVNVFHAQRKQELWDVLKDRLDLVMEANSVGWS
jgi:predicted oxidoreductase (fatty acid repression mutant protein)